ncbi:hypothetical protein LguiA_004371 [Lonicera macranthoides]
MGVRLDEEETVVKDTVKKSKHSKKNKMNDLKENSFTSSEGAEQRKRKKKRGVSGDIELDNALDEVENRKGCAEVDGDLQKETDQKKKKKKRKLEFGEDGVEVSEDVKKKKDKKEQDVSGVVQKEKDKKKKRKLEFGEDEDASNDEVQMEGEEKRHKSSAKEDISELKDGEEGSKEKKKSQDGKDATKMREENVGDNGGEVEKKRKKKRKKGILDAEIATEELGNQVGLEEKDFADIEGSATIEDSEGKNGKKIKRKKTKSAENDDENPKAKGKTPKKVSFSGNVEVFPASGELSTRNKENSEDDELVRGKRFSAEEDEMIKEAVQNYIDTHNLGEEGLNKVLNCSSHPELKNCWKEIGAAIPYRPFRAIYYRAHILFERGETRKWTQEEYEFIKKVQEKHGNNWKLIADELGKHRFHVKDTWRRIKLANMKKGHWSQEEYQTLFDLVNTDLQMKASEEKKSKHGMLRDNICWGAISDKLSTRTNQTCCRKWYTQLTSSMVEEGIWADVDDYRLLDALFNLDACCVEDVDWDSLLEHRSGEVCRKRWDQMVRHIGLHGLKSFSEQVDILAKRYCPALVEAREEWDSKPRVD